MTDNESLGIDCRRLGDAMRIVVSGELDVATEATFVEEAERSMASTDATRVVIDLQELAFADSSGLRGLLRCQEIATEHALALTLAIPESGFLDRLLDVAGVKAWFSYEG